MIGGEGAEASEQREEDGEGEHVGDREPRHEEADHAARQAPDEVHRGVDRIEPETGAEMGGIGAEAVIGVGAEHDEALDEQNEGEPTAHTTSGTPATSIDSSIASSSSFNVLVGRRSWRSPAIIHPLGFALPVCFRA